jgi:hypothetical protein
MRVCLWFSKALLGQCLTPFTSSSYCSTLNSRACDRDANWPTKSRLISDCLKSDKLCRYICLERLRIFKTTFSQESRCFGQFSNPEPREYMPGAFVVTTHCLVIRYQHFRMKVCLHPQSLNEIVDAVGHSNTSLSVCQTKRLSFPEDSCRCELVFSPRSAIGPSFWATRLDLSHPHRAIQSASSATQRGPAAIGCF